MVLLHIAHMDGNGFAGVNVAVRSFLDAQGKTEQAALLNVADVETEGAENAFSFQAYPSIRSLPEPFCRPDLIIFHELYRPRFLRLSSQADACHIPYIIIPHGGLTKKAQSIKKLKKAAANWLLFGRYIRHARAIQFLSLREQQESRGQKKGFLCPNGISRIRPKTWNGEPMRRIVYIGRLDIYIKGLDLMLEAVAACKEMMLKYNICLELYGPDENGSHLALRKRMEAYGLEQAVRLHGAVAGSKKQEILERADVFLQTSRSEGMSMGILEALSYGLPCILTEGTGMTALLERYHAGWACETDADSIAGAIYQVIREKDTFKEKSDGAISLIRENFLMENVTRRTISHYRRIAGRAEGDDHVSV